MPTLTLLIGPQASGKTTAARARFPHVTRISQDDRGRERHFREFQQALEQGADLLIDRLNYPREQRLRYVLPARAAGYQIHYLWFDADRTTCLQRLRRREQHPTVHPGQTDHEKMLENYFQHFETPEPDEYDRLDVLPVHARAAVVDLREILPPMRRIWLIGDVHGCFAELQQLLAQGRYQPEEDFLLFAGDLVNRGPQVGETLRFVYQVPRAVVVKGNHDDRLARRLAGLRLDPGNGLQASLDSLADWSPEEREACRQWIDDWPLLVRLPDLGGKPFYLVHAGVCGTRPLEDQYQDDCLQARYVGGRDHQDLSGGRFWYDTLTGDRRVAFGHAPHRNPYPAADVIALDGGAVKGGVLRAWLWTPGRPSTGPDGTGSEAHLLEVPGRS